MSEFERKLREFEANIAELVLRCYRNEDWRPIQERVNTLRAEILAMRKIAP